MSFPDYTITAPAEAQEELLALGPAAALSGTSKYLLGKLLNASFIKDTTRPSLKALRDAAQLSSGGLIPVIQTDVAEPTPSGDWRPYTGDAPWLSDRDWKLAHAGDWTAVNARKVIETGFILVVLGGVVTGLARVHGVLDTGDASRVRFDMDMVGRLTSDLAAGEVRIADDASPEERDLAVDLIGRRIEPKRGGSVAWI